MLISPHDTTRHASKVYSELQNLDFVTASCDSLPFEDASFDCAISFETIEHIDTQEQFVAELSRVLKPDGVLILSSPNKRLYSDAHDYHNEFHIRELYRNELEELLVDAFPRIRWYGQKLLFHSTIWPERRDFDAVEYILKDGPAVESVGQPGVEAMYYIVVCGRELPETEFALDKLSLFSDVTEVVYRHYASQSQRVLELDNVLIERDQQLSLRTEQLANRERLIAERDELLSLRSDQTDSLYTKIEERDKLLQLRTQQMAERETLIEERDEELVLQNENIAKLMELVAERDEQLSLRTRQMDRARAIDQRTR